MDISRTYHKHICHYCHCPTDLFDNIYRQTDTQRLHCLDDFIYLGMVEIPSLGLRNKFILIYPVFQENTEIAILESIYRHLVDLSHPGHIYIVMDDRHFEPNRLFNSHIQSISMAVQTEYVSESLPDHFSLHRICPLL